MSRDLAIFKGVVLRLCDIEKHFFSADEDKKRLRDHISSAIEEYCSNGEEEAATSFTTFLVTIKNNDSFEQTLPVLCEEVDTEDICTVFADFFTKHFPNLPSLFEIGFYDPEGCYVDPNQNNVPLREYFFNFDSDGLFEKRLTDAGKNAAKEFEKAGWIMQEDEWPEIS